MRNRLGILVLTAVGAIALTGCSPQLSPAAQQELDAALKAYEAGDNAQCAASAEKVLAESRKAPGAIEALYLRGLAKFRMNDFDAAKTDMTEVTERSKDQSLQARAWDVLGELAFQQGDMDAAAANLLQAAELSELDQKPSDHAHYRLGCIYQQQGKWDDADLHFQRVLFKFPGTDMAKRARLRCNARAWTIQVGAYKNSAQAKLEMRRLSGLKDAATIEPVVRDGNLTYLLQAGRWDDFSSAARTLPAVQKIKQDAFVTVTR